MKTLFFPLPKCSRLLMNPACYAPVLLLTALLHPCESRAAEEREWVKMETGTTEHFNGKTSLAVYSDRFVVAAGTNQTALLYNGTEWKPFPGINDSTLYGDGRDYALPLGGVAVASPTRVFFANYGGSANTTRRLFRWNEETWDRVQPTGSYDRLTSVWSARNSERVLVGTLAGIYGSNDGKTGWSLVSTNTVKAVQIRSISDDKIFALQLSDTPAIHLSTDGGLSFTGSISGLPASTLAFAPVAEDSIWVVGEGGMISHWDGTGFQAQSSTTTQDLRNVFAFSSTDVWAVGAANTLLHFDGTAWTQQVLDLDQQYTFYDIAGDQLGNLYIAGSDGLILYARAIPEPAAVALVLPALAWLWVGSRLRSSKGGQR